MKFKLLKLVLITFFIPVAGFSQQAYFIDGFHGGIWGHYPEGYTHYIVSQLSLNPDWKVNLEIEPETWEREQHTARAPFLDMQKYLAGSSDTARVEYVNPGYGQSYLFNISGESIIRQFEYGMKKLRVYFPGITFKTYSSEEPCFTSCLPQILSSFGMKYASLKNPNTCWGGYTRAFGGEFVNWIGPDGTSLPTVPRYEIEALKPGSTWETIASSNSKTYISNALDYGIAKPVGMCLQDAGWRFGPWLKGDYYKPTEYSTWKNYFQNNTGVKATDWRLSQEDVLVSLVWGAQVLQKIAQEVRVAENTIVQAEKIASINALQVNKSYPAQVFENAWHPLLLSQHHDCWIVPYNGKRGDTWADKVVTWTSTTRKISDSLISATNTKNSTNFRIYNTTAYPRKEWAEIPIPAQLRTSKITVQDQTGKSLKSQALSNDALLVEASVPSMGFTDVSIVKGQSARASAMVAKHLPDGKFLLESDLYKIVLDTEHGGVITSLYAKGLGNKDFVDQQNDRKFNEIRGFFPEKEKFISSADAPAKISITDQGMARVKINIEGKIDDTPFIQTLTLTQGQKRIDFLLKINWNGNKRIGAPDAKKLESTDLKKGFYDDRYKLSALFPVDLANQKIYKNAPFDVTESKLSNTFFASWDSIKNNIIVNWVDVTDGKDKYGMALFTDHTSNYSHGEISPLGLTLQYSGPGLWGRNYTINGPSEFHYALLPHENKWDKATVWTESVNFNEPLKVLAGNNGNKGSEISLLKLSKPGYEVSSVQGDRKNLTIRLYNAESDATPVRISVQKEITQLKLVNLDGQRISDIKAVHRGKEYSEFELSIPRFGIRTITINE